MQRSVPAVLSWRGTSRSMCTDPERGGERTGTPSRSRRSGRAECGPAILDSGRGIWRS
jgi:hypothetical protein